MSIRVGVPRGLLYYYYGDIWRNFFARLDAEVVISGETNQTVIEHGGVVDEVCLPVKVYVGHVQQLADRVDYLFMPRIISTAPGMYSCPKIIGLPDMVRSSIRYLPPVIDVSVNLRNGRRGLYEAVIAAGKQLGKHAVASLYAWQRACSAASRQISGSATVESRPRVAVIGHPYLLHDSHVSMDLLAKLASFGANLVTSEQVGMSESEVAARRLRKKLFWNHCHRLAGAALAVMYSPQPLDGVIFVTSFACGPDSFVGEVLKLHARQMGIPFLMITLDEHTAEAGFVTRLEAFVDLLARREQG